MVLVVQLIIQEKVEVVVKMVYMKGLVELLVEEVEVEKMIVLVMVLMVEKVVLESYGEMVVLILTILQMCSIILLLNIFCYEGRNKVKYF